MNVVNLMTNWNQGENNKYIRTFVEPYDLLSPHSSDIANKVEIKIH